MKKLFTCLYGSRLYGTQTPTSDLDVKHVYLPSLDDLLLGKKLQNTVNQTNKAANTRNSKDDTDEEFIPLHVFARDFLGGQTYALELAFALEGTHAGQILDQQHGAQFSELVTHLRENFLTRNINAMMGYVVNQATMYSFKGERLNAVREVQELLLRVPDPEARVKDVWDLSPEFVAGAQDLAGKFPKYFKVTEYDIGNGRMAPAFKLLETTLPFSSRVGHSIGVINALESKYGTRADAASQTNVDWKATMHALRILDEGLMLLNHHKLEFPFNQMQVGKLLKIKHGEVAIESIREELDSKLEQLKNLEKVSSLPDRTPELTQKLDAFLLQHLRKFYWPDIRYSIK